MRIKKVAAYSFITGISVIGAVIGVLLHNPPYSSVQQNLSVQEIPEMPQPALTMSDNLSPSPLESIAASEPQTPMPSRKFMGMITSFHLYPGGEYGASFQQHDQKTINVTKGTFSGNDLAFLVESAKQNSLFFRIGVRPGGKGFLLDYASLVTRAEYSEIVERRQAVAAAISNGNVYDIPSLESFIAVGLSGALPLSEQITRHAGYLNILANQDGTYKVRFLQDGVRLIEAEPGSFSIESLRSLMKDAKESNSLFEIGLRHQNGSRVLDYAKVISAGDYKQITTQKAFLLGRMRSLLE